MRPGLRLVPGSLAAAVAARTRIALASGALQPLASTCETIADGAIRFTLRRLEGHAHKEVSTPGPPGAAAPPDPFLPYEEALSVADVTADHVALLNKFSVVDGHVLVVTRDFEHQERLLTVADFVALAACLREFPCLAFYNGGRDAGSSQPHKHLQLVPLPLAGGGPAAPVEAVLDSAPRSQAPLVVPALPFRHAFGWLDEAAFAAVDGAAAMLARSYATLLAAAGVGRVERADGAWQRSPYNLLATTRWMLVVPRSREHFAGASINALGFAGSLFVRDAEARAAVRAAGPLAALRAVAEPSTGVPAC